MVINGFHDVVEFKLPQSPEGSGWQLLIDTNAQDAHDRSLFAFVQSYEVTERSLLVFLLKGRQAT